MLATVKLAAVRAWSAWRGFPTVRRALLAVSPGPPVLVTGVYRSGTSWAGAMLAPAGLWHLHEPFNPNRGLWRDELPFADPATACPPVDELVARLLRGRHRAAVLRLPRSSRWFMPLRFLPIRPRRVLIKDPSAAFLSEYLVRRHGMQAVVMFRHPAAVVGSFLRLGWPTGTLVERLLANRALVDGPLGMAAEPMEVAVGRADAFSGAVLCACVARALWDFSERNPGSMIRVSFEKLCRDPFGGFRALFERLDLGYDERVRREHVRLTDGEERVARGDYGVARRSADLARIWRTRVSPADLTVIRSTWERLGPPLYQDPVDWSAEGECA
ncbi:MAG TPA: hypothetical protein VJ788_03585 [Gemmatimonadota bacterium]|nr:hypothetical protein [Gemmatimonadota bacterium]